MDMKTYDVAIVGGGIAGYSAALTCKSLNLDYIWLGEKGYGGKLAQAEYVRNYPAVHGKGADFVKLLEKQRKAEDVVLTEARIDGVYKTDDGYVLAAREEAYSSRTVILCTGVETAGAIPGEREFIGRGVSYCAVCDGALYKGEEIAAVISDEKFAGEADYLAEFAKTVHLFCLDGAPMCKKENIIQHAGRPREVAGGARVERLVLDVGELKVAGVFFLKNSAPPQTLVGGLETDGAHVRVWRDLSTNLEGLFAAGDITGRPYQYVKAAGEGCTAAYSARDFLRGEKSFSNRLYSEPKQSIIEKTPSEDTMQKPAKGKPAQAPKEPTRFIETPRPHIIKTGERREGVRIFALKKRSEEAEPVLTAQQDTGTAPAKPVQTAEQMAQTEQAKWAAEQARLAAEQAKWAAEQARLAAEQIRRAAEEARWAAEYARRAEEPKSEKKEKKEEPQSVIAAMPEDTTLTEDEWLKQEAFRILEIKRKN